MVLTKLAGYLHYNLYLIPYHWGISDFIKAEAVVLKQFPKARRYIQSKHIQKAVANIFRIPGKAEWGDEKGAPGFPFLPFAWPLLDLPGDSVPFALGPAIMFYFHSHKNTFEARIKF